MSRTIEIKDLPDDLVERLEKRAERDGTTLNAMILGELEQLAPAGLLTLTEWAAITRLRKVRGPSRSDILEAIHQGREERGAQIEAAVMANRAAAR